MPFQLFDLLPEEQDALREVFRASYAQATGAAWSDDTFYDRARSWTFYGALAPVGVVAVRKQRSGFWKLVGVAGHPRSVLKGIRELKEENAALWGAVSADMLPLCERMGLIAPHQKPENLPLIRMLVHQVPASVFGGYTPTVLSDGSLTLYVEDIGEVHKYLVVSPEYLKRAAPLMFLRHF